MALPALALLLGAALLHATWNLLLKRSADRSLVIWWAMLASGLLALPLVFAGPPLPARAWPLAVASALVEAVYLLGLAAAYRLDDFSAIYPIARGAAPAFLVLWAVLFLGERPGPQGMLGIAVLVVGLLVVGSSAGKGSPVDVRHRYSGVAAAMGIALCISIYSAIDGAAVQFSSPVPYTALVFALTALAMTPWVLARQGGPKALAVWRTGWMRALAVGLLSLVAYTMVLAAYSIAPVSYGGAIREVSVVFAALAGWRWLGEGFGPRRLAGSLLIFAGVLAIALV